MNTIKRIMGWLPILLVSVLLLRCSQSTERPPNIVLIMADDLGYGDLSCYGQNLFQTPNIDRLAAEGMRFTQHYAGSTVCAPSRCVIMTGKHTGHSWVRGNYQAQPSGQLPLPDKEQTIAEILQQQGYKTGCFGKWGLGVAENEGDPLKQGFDEFYGYYDQVLAHNSYPEFLYLNGQKEMLDNEVQYKSKDHWSKGLASYSTQKVTNAHELIFEHALDFLQKNKDNPFFLYYPTTIPHINDDAPKGIRFEALPGDEFADRDWNGEQQAYASLVRQLDRYVGILMEKIKELGLDNNTLVFFTSDNGPFNEEEIINHFNSNGGLRGGKRDLYEGGIRVPLIARWPGNIRAGSESGHISAFQDYFPTLCQLTGADTPAGLDGLSFLPALRGEEQPVHSYLYWEFHWWKPSLRALRMGDWKAVQNGPASKIELYNLTVDPGEKNDVASQNGVVIEKIEKLLDSARSPSDIWKWRK